MQLSVVNASAHVAPAADAAQKATETKRRNKDTHTRKQNTHRYLAQTHTEHTHALTVHIRTLRSTYRSQSESTVDRDHQMSCPAARATQTSRNFGGRGVDVGTLAPVEKCRRKASHFESPQLRESERAKAVDTAAGRATSAALEAHSHTPLSRTYPRRQKPRRKQQKPRLTPRGKKQKKRQQPLTHTARRHPRLGQTTSFLSD